MEFSNNYLKVSGDYFEMGIKQGEYFSKDISGSFDYFLNSKIVKIMKPSFLPKFAFSYLLKKQIIKKWQRPIEILIPDYSQRIRGIAHGSRTPLEQLYTFQALEVLANDSTYLLACSSICILPSSFKTTFTILAKNFDYFTEFPNDHIVRQSKPKKGFKSLELTYKQIAGAHEGINEKGLVVLYNYGLNRLKTETRIPITILVQQILERCSNVDEAVTFIKTFRYPNGAILTLADSANKAVVVELTPEHIGFRKPENGILLSTNSFLSEEIKPFNIPNDVCFKNRKFPAELRNKRVHQSDEKRYERMTQLCKKSLFIDVKTLENILKDHSERDIGDDDTICRHGSLISTQLGVIFIPKSRTIRVYFGSPCKNNMLEYQID